MILAVQRACGVGDLAGESDGCQLSFRKLSFRGFDFRLHFGELALQCERALRTWPTARHRDVMERFARRRQEERLWMLRGK